MASLCRSVPILALPILLAAAPATGPTTSPASPAADRRTFDLRPEPPPTPALRYRLVTDPADAWPGNAAVTYLQAAVALGNRDDDHIDKAFDADAAHDAAAFEAAVAPLIAEQNVFDLLATAARQDRCEWETPVREQGIRSLVPELNWLRVLAQLVDLRGRHELKTGRPGEAVETLRLGYRLAAAADRDAFLVSGLVSAGLTAEMDRAVAELMNRPDAPNLYWALAGLPRPTASLRHAMAGERLDWAVISPTLTRRGGGGGGPVEGTPEDWEAIERESHEYVAVLRKSWASFTPAATPRPAWQALDAATAESLRPAAVAYYAATRHVDPAVAERLDPRAVAATYLIGQDAVAADEVFKLVPLPYPQLLPRAADLPARLARMGITAPTPFIVDMPSLGRACRTFARTDREVAALTAVEALRSYAADHGGRLPDGLSDVTDTPVPDNPVTGRPFEYRLDNGTATLADHSPLLADRPLEYTVRVRQP